MTDHIGEQFGNYQLIRLLGQGGFADVYLGEHIFLKTYVAVKLLQVRLLGSSLEDFLNEARIITRLEHPHIISVLDFGLHDDSPYLVLSYAPHGSLRQRYPYGTILPLNHVITFVKQVAEALQYAHDQRLIHRDIKPENMLLGQRNELLLSDFGITSVMQSSRPHGVHEIVGTVAYMAPEQIEGKPGPASDQYSLGIVVYEWLCGRRPFEGIFAELCTQQMVKQPPSLCGRMPSIPSAVEMVVNTALAKDPSQRFANVRAFANALDQASRDTTIYAPRTVSGSSPYQGSGSSPYQGSGSSPYQGSGSSPYQGSGSSPYQGSDPLPHYVNIAPNMRNWTPPDQPITPPVLREAPPPLVETPVKQEPDDPVPLTTSKPNISRRRALVGIAALAGAALIVGGLELWTHRPGNAPVLAKAKQGTLLYTYPYHGDHIESVAWSPDSKRIVSASDDKSARVWDATTGTHAIIYNGHNNAVNSVAWSPDGKRIVSGSNDQTAQVWDASHGNRLFIYQGHAGSNGGGITAVAWSPDGNRIASGGFDKTVQVWDATNGNPLVKYTGHTDEVHAVAWSPDSSSIVSAGTDSTVRVWDATTGKTMVQYPGHQGYRVQAVTWSPNGAYIASGGFDKTVQVWDAASGVSIFNHPGLQYVNALSWLPRGMLLAIGNGDPTVQEWDPIAGRLLFTHVGPPGYVLTVAWAPSGQLMVSGGSNNAVQVWQAM